MNVLILGNGFDLDVNYKTRYSDFAKNVRLCWPFEDAKDGLGGYLQERAKTDTWLDLESALLDYASATDGVAKKGDGGLYPLEDDKEDFQRLVHTLRKYIARMIDEPPVNKDSVAAQVLDAVLKSPDSVIYSFNYTNLRKIAYALYVNDSRHDRQDYNLDYAPVHGSIETNDIILGVNSDADLIEGYEFLRKNEQPDYKPTNLRQDIFSAREVTFFGLSMGQIDYPYFRDFFYSLCSGVVPTDQKKHITIFTYDDISRSAILKQLRSLTGTDLMTLQGNSYFQIIRTKNQCSKDRQLFERWMRRQMCKNI